MTSWRRHRAGVEGREPLLYLADACERRVPAGFQFGRDQAHVGIDALVAARSELRVIPHVIELQGEHVALGPLPLVRAVRRVDRRVNQLRRDGLQDLLADRVFDGLPRADTHAAPPVW